MSKTQRNPFDYNLHEYIVRSTGPGGELPECNRGSWYCPTVSQTKAKALARMLDREDINRVYDLGAGDLRLSIWLSQQGYDAIAYETLSDITDAVAERFDLSGIDLRNRDYYADWGTISDGRDAYVAFGAANKLPGVPDTGLAIQGYGEIGYRAYLDGEEISERWITELSR